MEKQQIVNPGPNNSLLNKYGEKVIPPKGWVFLPAGDAAITRKITSGGVFWRVQFKKGRRMISKGIWAPKEVIIEAQEQVAQMRSSESYQKKRVSDLKRRAKKQDEYEVETRSSESYQKKRVSDLKRRAKKQDDYEVEFKNQVQRFLNFNAKYKTFETQMATAITKHAIPVGSGTVARTAMIPIEERAAKAVIAWMRHQTTAYDQLQIARIKGERRAVRRQLAQKSIQLLEKYRSGAEIPVNCPLKNAISRIN